MGVDLKFMSIWFNPLPAEWGLVSEQCPLCVQSLMWQHQALSENSDMDKRKFKQISLYLLSIFMDEK